MISQKLVLFASLFIIGCGEKSDEERIDDLLEQCQSMCDSTNALADKCGFTQVDCECADRAAKTEEFGCIDEAEAIFKCMDGIGLDSLTCSDDLLGALESCADTTATWHACASEDEDAGE